jgi:hypothetical protein
LVKITLRKDFSTKAKIKSAFTNQRKETLNYIHLLKKGILKAKLKMHDRDFKISIYLCFNFTGDELIFYDPTENNFFGARESQIYNLDVISRWGEELQFFTVHVEKPD